MRRFGKAQQANQKTPYSNTLQQSIKIQRMQPTVSIALIAAILFSCSAAEEASTYATDACTAAKVLTEITNAIEEKATASITSIHTTRTRLAQAKAAMAISNDLELRKKAAPIALVLQTKLESLTSAHSNLVTASYVTIRKLANLSGQQHATAIHAGTAVKTTSTGNDDPSSAVSGAGSIQFSVPPTAWSDQCASSINTKHAKFKSWASQEGLENVNIYKLSANPKTSTTRKPAVGKNSGGTCTAADDQRDGSGMSSSNICVVGGPVFDQKATRHTKGEQQDYGRAANPGKEDETDDSYAQNTLAQTLAVVKRWSTELENFDPDTLTSYKDDNDFKRAVAAIFGGLSPEEIAKAKPADVQTIITNAYGNPTN
uniref:Variant surface glycoprotein 1125.5144 n=1 Tax=Trypanosoma brucei TaxID=5691 RepID=A0A1J0RBV1_9TRYP|nr:variant surface glycoprotein 1125.5144 [Trypanosoma brucei]